MSNMERPVGVHYDGDLRAELVSAAADLVADRGVDGLSLREVARRVGVSHAAPAHHFGDRAGLLTAVAAEGFRRFLARTSVAGAAAGTPVEVLTGLALAYAAFARDERGWFDVMFTPALVRTDDPAYEHAGRAAFDALAAVVARLQTDGWRPDQDTPTLAAAAWSFAHGIAVLQRQGALPRHHGPDGAEDPDGARDVAAIAAALL